MDEIVFYTPLNKEQIGQIANLTLEALNRRLAERGVTVRLTDAARDYVIENGYDPIYGARPLKRFIQRAVETPVARILIAEDVPEGGTLEVYPQGDELAVRIV